MRRMSAPLVFLHASMAATKLSDLHAHHIRSLASALACVKKQDPTIRLISSDPKQSNENQFSPYSISDGSMANKGDNKRGGGHIIFRPSINVIHTMLWCTRLLRRLSRSSETGETLSAADTVSNGLDRHASLTNVLLTPETELTVDSTSLLALSTSVKEPEERYNKNDLAEIHGAFVDGRLSAVHWCPAKKLLAHPPTHESPNTAVLRPPCNPENTVDQKKPVLAWGQLQS